MKNRILFVLIVLSPAVSAQSDSSFSKKPTYFYTVHAGGLLAKKGNGSSLTTSTIHGIRYKNLAFGIGLGYDAYLEWRALPVFGSVSYDFAHIRRNTFFVQMNAGYSQAWNPLSDDDQFIFDERGGMVIHPLVGYRISSDKFSVYLTAGYKFQRIEYEQTPRWWIWGYPGSKTTVVRDIERISIQIGFGYH